MPRISVIMPTFNQRSMIGEAVDSALTQTVDDFELIIVNDGSTDGTSEYLRTLRDPRVRVIDKPNGGIASALNAGIALARGELLTWISSDNVSAPFFIESFLAAFAAAPDCAYAYAAYHEIDDAGRYLRLVSGNYLKLRDLTFNFNVGNASFMYRRACHEKLGLYDERLRFSQDTDFWGRVVRTYPTVYLIEPNYYYRVHAATGTARVTSAIAERETAIWNQQISSYFDQAGTIDRVIADLYPSVGPGADPDLQMECLLDLIGHIVLRGYSALALSLIGSVLGAVPADRIADLMQLAADLMPSPIDEGWAALRLRANAGLTPEQQDAYRQVWTALARSPHMPKPMQRARRLRSQEIAEREAEAVRKISSMAQLRPAHRGLPS